MTSLATLLLAVMLAQPELLDRTVAIVGGQPITLSDVRAAIALGLVDGAKAPIADVTARLVDRELILREVRRYAPAAPEASEVDARLERIHEQIGKPIGPVLEAFGFTADRLRAWVRDDLRTEAYLAQRFASASLPSDAEVSQAYTRQRAEFDQARMTFEQAAPIVRDRLVAARRRELVIDWLSDLRRRTDVVILQP